MYDEYTVKTYKYLFECRNTSRRVANCLHGEPVVRFTRLARTEFVMCTTTITNDTACILAVI